MIPLLLFLSISGGSGGGSGRRKSECKRRRLLLHHITLLLFVLIGAILTSCFCGVDARRGAYYSLRSKTRTSLLLPTPPSSSIVPVLLQQLVVVVGNHHKGPRHEQQRQRPHVVTRYDIDNNNHDDDHDDHDSSFSSSSLFFLYSLRGGDGGAYTSITSNPISPNPISTSTTTTLLDVEEIASVGTILWLIHATYIVLSPRKALKLYGIMGGGTPMLTWMNRRIGIGHVHIALVSFCLLFGEMTQNQAIGYGFLPWIIILLSSLLNDDAKELGLNRTTFNIAQSIILIMIVFGTYTCFVDATYANTVITVIGIVLVLHGIPMYLAPVSNGKPLGFPNSTFHNLLARQHGISLVGSGILLLCLATNANINTPIGHTTTTTTTTDIIPVALGYSMIPFLIHQLVMTIISHQVDQLGMPKRYHYLWLLFLIVMTGTLIAEWPIRLLISICQYCITRLSPLELHLNHASHTILKIVV